MRISSFLLGCLAAVCLSLAIVIPSTAMDYNDVIIDQPAIDQVQFDSFATVLTESDDFNWGAPATDNRVLVAVDNSISPLCRPGAPDSYSRPGGFCSSVAAYSTKSVYSDGSKAPCPIGEEPNPSPPPACIPEV